MIFNDEVSKAIAPERKIFCMLEDAIIYDNTDVLERIIAHYGFDVNKRGDYGMTLAMLAAKLVRPNALRVLEKHGARFDLTDSRKAGLLHYICGFRNLYDEARKATAKARLGNSLQMIFSDLPSLPENYYKELYNSSDSIDDFKARASLLRFLVEEKGLNVNAKDDNGDTPLMFALKALAKPLVDELVRLGADPCIMNNNFRNSIDIAKECGLDPESLFRSRDTLSL